MLPLPGAISLLAESDAAKSSKIRAEYSAKRIGNADKISPNGTGPKRHPSPAGKSLT